MANALELLDSDLEDLDYYKKQWEIIEAREEQAVKIARFLFSAAPFQKPDVAMEKYFDRIVGERPDKEDLRRLVLNQAYLQHLHPQLIRQDAFYIESVQIIADQVKQISLRQPLTNIWSMNVERHTKRALKELGLDADEGLVKQALNQM